MNIKQIALIFTSITCIATNTTFSQDNNQTLRTLSGFECSCNVVYDCYDFYKETPQLNGCNTLGKHTPQSIAHSLVHDSPQEQEKKMLAIAAAFKALNRFLPYGNLNDENIAHIKNLIKQEVEKQKEQIIKNIDTNRKNFNDNALNKPSVK